MPGAIYKVERALSLQAPVTWDLVVGGIAGTGTVETVTDPGGASRDYATYRVIAE